MIVVLLGFTATITPYRTSFFTTQMLHVYDYFDVMESFVDTVFIIDIFVNFMSAYEQDNGNIEMRPRKIAINYLTGFFIIDFLASFPMDLVLN